MSANEMQKSQIYSTYFAPRGRARIYNLGIQISQTHLSPFDRLIGIIGEAGSGKSLLVKGMFPGLELTNDDDGVNVRPLPLLDQDLETGFFSPHTYHLDVRFEMGFHQMRELSDAVLQAVHRGKRVVIEHFDLIYPFLQMNADLLIGVGEEIVVTRPTLFGPEPQEIYDVVYKSLPYRLMTHSAEDLTERFLDPADVARCTHDDVHHGFVLRFAERCPAVDLPEIEKKVQQCILEDMPIDYVDSTHVRIGELVQMCTGPRTHVRSTGRIKGFRLMDRFVYDSLHDAYLLIGCVGEDSEENLRKLDRMASR